MPEAYNPANLVNLSLLKTALQRSMSHLESYTDSQAFVDIKVDIKFENNRLKFYTQEALDTAEENETIPDAVAIVDFPLKQFLDEHSFDHSFTFAKWNANPVGSEKHYKIAYNVNKVDPEDP